jgi:hypothetical protein
MPSPKAIVAQTQLNEVAQSRRQCEVFNVLYLLLYPPYLPIAMNGLLIAIDDVGMIYTGLKCGMSELGCLIGASVDLAKSLTLISPLDASSSPCATDSASFLLKQ